MGFSKSIVLELWQMIPTTDVFFLSHLQDIDYFESFTPTASHYITIRLVLDITAVPGLFSYDYDTVCAFINTPLPVEVFFLALALGKFSDKNLQHQ
jgi:hypothetical protein